MVTLDQVEKLREKANVSYDEAKAALEAADGNLLEALINLEKQGKVTPPAGGGYYNSEKNASESAVQASPGKESKKSNRQSLADLMKTFLRFCGKMIHKGNINSFEVLKDGEIRTTFSVTVLVVLAACFFWITIPLIVIGLFLGYRYRFRGPDLGRDAVNNAMETAANTADNIKQSFSGQKE